MINKVLSKEIALSADAAVAATNNILDKLHEQLRDMRLPDFGGGMLQFDDHTIVRTTQAARVLKKYERPIPDRDEQLERECFASWIAFEEHLKSYNLYKSMDMHPNGRKTVYQARILIADWLKDFKCGPTQFTPGEVFTSSRGACSIYQKLSKKKYWEVTHDACDSFIRLVYNNLSLKRCAKSFFSRKTRKELNDLWFEHSHAPHVGFSIFRHRMLDEVLTIVHGSRASSVPKDNSKRRFINVEPLGNVILQRQVGLGIRQILSNIGNDLTIGQDVHQSRISSKNVSTIDFSNASDSTITAFCEFFLPQHFMKKYIQRYRSPMTLIDGAYHVPYKVSSMGNGFTFELMTIILLALARVNDAYATVYGDDVIISNEHASTFVEAAAIAGYKVNEKKSFINSRFRESCGSFFLDDYGYVTCYDIRYCASMADVIVTANKLRKIALASYDACFLEAYEGIVSCAPALFKGPVNENSLDTHIGVIDFTKKRSMQNRTSRTVFQRVQQRYGLQLRSLQYTNWTVVMVPKFRSKVVSTSPLDVKTPARLASYYYSMQRSKDVNRNEGQWEYHPHLIQSDGKLLPVSDLEFSRNEDLRVLVSLICYQKVAPVARLTHDTGYLD